MMQRERKKRSGFVFCGHNCHPDGCRSTIHGFLWPLEGSSLSRHLKKPHKFCSESCPGWRNEDQKNLEIKFEEGISEPPGFECWMVHGTQMPLDDDEISIEMPDIEMISSTVVLPNSGNTCTGPSSYPKNFTQSSLRY